MGMLVACAKGCGELLDVTDEMMEEAKKSGLGLVVQHERCANEPGVPFRKFKISIEVLELLDHHICDICDGKLKQDDATTVGWVHEDEAKNADHIVIPTDNIKLAGIGAEESALTFKAAVPKLQDALNSQWGRVVGLAPIVDAGQDPGPESGQPA